jgi:hypothetical protein
MVCSLFVSAALLAACGGVAAPATPVPAGVAAPPASAPDDATSPGASGATASPGAPAPGAAGSEPPASPATGVLPSIKPEETRAILASPVATASRAGDTVVRSLLDQSGITAALGADAEPMVRAILQAEHQAATAEFVRLGGDPATLGRAGGTATLAAWTPARSHGAPTTAAGTPGDLVGVLGMAVAELQAIMDLSVGAHDEQGVIRNRNQIGPVTQTGGGLTLTLDETVSFEIAHCPDPAGSAEGTIDIEMVASGTGTVDGAPFSASAQATFSIRVTATADANAALASVSATADGTMSTSTEGGAPTSTTLEGATVTMPLSGGKLSGKATGSGTWSGTPGSAESVSGSLIQFAAALGFVNGTTAETWWRAGHCVRVEHDPDGDVTANADNSADVEVRGVSVVGGADVSGRLTISPDNGTFDPLEADAPATIHGRIKAGSGSASATVRLVSRRGIGTGEIRLRPAGYKVDLGGKGMTISGTKCNGPTGAWKLRVGGKVVQDALTVKFSGSITAAVDEDLGGTYSVSIAAAAAGLPAPILAGLAIHGKGTVRFDPDALALRFLDGTLGGSGTASGPGTLVFVGLTPSDASGTTIPVQREPCK